MKIIKISNTDADRIASLAAAFRTQLKSYKGIQSQPDINAGKEEILEFLESGFPVYAAEDQGDFVGYIVCRIDEPCLWVEHIFVREDCRRKGIATMLFNKAEEIAASMGEDTVYNFVHPNNENMIRFLRTKGYTVLNMIEIRKPYAGETLTTTIPVGKEVFDY
ncbi:MAG: GNAT family N-acetyltransferase [Lachnospiraceae bacterium]|nr:GNAT family N-acetyltransferase [Lachnospiraceae bacterium]